MVRGFSHKLGKGARSWLAPVPPAWPQIPASTSSRFLRQVDSGWCPPPQGEGVTLLLPPGGHGAPSPSLVLFVLVEWISHTFHTCPFHRIPSGKRVNTEERGEQEEEQG